MLQLLKKTCFATLWILTSMGTANAVEFSHRFNLHDDFTQYLKSQTGAGVFDDPVSQGVKYWIPTQAGEWGEVVYEFPVGFQIEKAELDTGIASFGVFDLGAEAHLDVSPDGTNWTTVMSRTSANNLPDNHYAYGPGDISSIVEGSESIFVRSRLLSTQTHWTGQSFYAQFMRGDTNYSPAVVDGGLPTFSISASAPPEPPPISVFDRDMAGWQAAVTATQLPAQYLTTINFDDVPSHTRSLPADFYRGYPGSPSIGVVQADLLKGRKVEIHQGWAEEHPVSPPNAMGLNRDFGTVVRVEFSEPIVGMGAQFLDVEPRGYETTGFDTDDDGIVDVRFSNPPGDASQAFLGFMSDKPLDHVNIHFASTCLPVGDPACGDGISIDNLEYLMQPNTLALHEGSRDPLNEKWTFERPLVGATAFPVTNDQGFQAWSVKDLGWGDGAYGTVLDDNDAKRAMKEGWTLSGRLRAEAAGMGTTTLGVIFNDPSPRAFGINLVNVAGKNVIRLGGEDENILEFPIDVDLSDYHHYELVYDPSTDLATFYIDGVETKAGYKGHLYLGTHKNIVTMGSGDTDNSGQGNYNLVEFKINSPAAQGLPVGNLLQNAGFDHSEESTAPTTHFRDWGGDAARFVREESGVVAAGTEMLQFISTSADDTTSDVNQYVDVSIYRDQIRTGYVRAELSADFNRVGTDVADTGFAVTLAAHNGTPASSPTHATAIDGEMTPIETDGEAATWQTATVTLAVPFNAEFLQATLSAVKNATGELPGKDFSGHFADNASLTLYLLGDINNDGAWSVDDLDQLSQAIRSGTTTRRMDINGNGTVTPEDRRLWVESLANTYFGDANFDGQFDSGDLVYVFQAGEYEDGVASNSTWSDGDFSGDSEFDSADLIVAFQFGVYGGGPRPASVPEPSCLALLAIVLMGLARPIRGGVA